jgi:hypothetical protein
MFAKNKIINYLIIFFIILIIFLIGVLQYDFFTRSDNTENIAISASSETMTSEKLNIIDEKEKWKEKIISAGPKTAYGEFKQAFSSFRFDQQHVMAHLFGELLYQEGGTAYLETCDSEFSFGCYHGFFTTAIYGEGDSVIMELDRICIETGGLGASGCQHGLGHGLVEYYGHTLDGLKNALQSCEDTTSYSKKFGCTLCQYSNLLSKYSTSK